MDLWAGGSIGENIRFAFERIRHATQESGWPEGSVRHVAATKSVGLDQIREGIAAGLTILGENRFPKSRGCGGNRFRGILSGTYSGERFDQSWRPLP